MAFLWALNTGKAATRNPDFSLSVASGAVPLADGVAGCDFNRNANYRVKCLSHEPLSPWLPQTGQAVEVCMSARFL
jgi:hypothetical protein